MIAVALRLLFDATKEVFDVVTVVLPVGSLSDNEKPATAILYFPEAATLLLDTPINVFVIVHTWKVLLLTATPIAPTAPPSALADTLHSDAVMVVFASVFTDDCWLKNVKPIVATVVSLEEVETWHLDADINVSFITFQEEPML